LPALCIGSAAIVGKEGLLAKVVKATLIFGVIGPLCDARLAEEIVGGIVAPVPAISLLAAMHPPIMLNVHRLQLCLTIQAIKGHHGLRFHKITYVADAHKGGFGQPPGIYILPKPKQRQQDLEVVAIVQIQSPPDRQLYEVAKVVLVICG
jgi:hypothetical protein